MSTKLSEELKWRGLVGQTTIDDLSALDQPGAFYFGADPSADSMTIGNLAGLVTCLRFIRAGYKAIFLAGGRPVGPVATLMVRMRLEPSWMRQRSSAESGCYNGRLSGSCVILIS